MKILSVILVAIAMAVACWDVSAQTPPDAVGVPTVGTPPPCTGTGLRCSNLTGRPYVLLGGYYNLADGAGGYLAMGASGCTDNGGTVFKDSAGNCFYRMDDRAAIPVNWFGAKCDGTTMPVGGAIAAGSATFTSTSVTFQPSDVGKVIQFDYQAGSPFRTTISAYISGTQVTLANAPGTGWPGQVGATSANFNPSLQNGLNSPGAGYAPQDVLTVQGGSFSSPATATVRATSLVALGSTSAGTGYAVGDSIYFSALPAASYATVNAAEIQVQSVNPSTGAVTGYTFVSNGDFRPTSGSITTNPSSFAVSTSGSGSGFTVSLLAGNASFGVAEVYNAPTSSGQYTPTPAGLPPIPSATSDSGTGSGATIDLAFQMPTFTYGTDDTAALQALETWMETDYSRGMYHAAEVPGDHTCLLQTLEIQRPVTWRSSGSRQAQLKQVMGSQGSTVDGTDYGFILVAVNYSASDPYQDRTVGETEVGLNNLSIIGATKATSVVVNGTSTAYANAGLLFQNSTGTAPNVRGALETLQVANFPGNALAANAFSGELRGYNVVAGSSAGNCVDLEHTANPYRFYGLVASGCTIGLNLAKTKSEEFHGVSVFGNTVDVSVTGSTAVGGYVLFDGTQFQNSRQENMYLDQQNETVLCAANCVFEGAWQTRCLSNQSCAAIEIGPDARTKATGNAPVIAQFNQGVFSSAVPYDVYFDTNTTTGKTCHCRVALGGGMYDVATQSGTGIPTTNVPAQLTGQTTYAPPVFANAANIGVPLSLGPAEFGIGLSRDVESQPSGAGVKLRVECSQTVPGAARIVALAGGSNTPKILLDGIGSGVQGC